MWNLKKPGSERIRVRIGIKRRESAAEPSYGQLIDYGTNNPKATLLSALNDINDNPAYTDINGKAVGQISFEQSCLQKKCGACAMVINGRPGLACSYFLKDHPRGKVLKVEPLRKFPVIRDLRVDRSILFKNLETFGMWAEEEAKGKRGDDAYEASKCLQCGCCLDVCPNFSPGDGFYGAAAFVPSMRLLSSLSDGDRARVKASYMEHGFKGCGKSLSCAGICPAGIDIEGLLVHANALTFGRKPR